ncbi:RagB/SusD family nutrient uptake outer membrane protein [Sphingobacterium faecium]|uniref:RagB/SusD family nutrient uptake outer membrane protein n=1 Tax=Sphingobacterium faecium TaxID=34087 RepID=UPI0032093AA0
MKKILISALLAFSMIRCSYLDVVPDNSNKIADDFKNENTANNFVFSCYNFIPNYNNFRQNFNWAMSNELVGANHWTAEWFDFLKIQQGLMNRSTPVLDIWKNCYQGIRQCYIFLDNIENVKPLTISPEEYASKKKSWIGEVRFLIAYYHFVLMQNYGPVVISDHLVPYNATGEEMFQYRASFDECVTKVAAMFDQAIADLPLTVDASNYGRATKVVAQSLKSKMYLIAASPLFNGNAEFYADFKNNNGTQLISQTFDKEKWKVAMTETKKAIEMAESSGNKLYTYNKTSISDPFQQAVMNCRWGMVDPWNSELIWGYSGNRETAGSGGSFQTHVIPIGWRTSTPYGALGPTLTTVEMFYSKNGIPADKDPNYNWANRFNIATGDETIELHRNREPRFYAYIGFDRGDYEISGTTKKLLLRANELNGMKSFTTDHLFSGYAVKKGVHPNSKVDATQFNITTYPYPIIRLGELYLNYAEASAVYNGTLDADGLSYMNAIRTRAGIKGLYEAYGKALSGEELLQAVRRERMIELMFEGHWLADLKRWKIAESFFAKDRQGMRGLYDRGKTAADFYRETVLIGKPYIFDRKNYLFPINQTYVDVNHNLTQNPGW